MTSSRLLSEIRSAPKMSSSLSSISSLNSMSLEVVGGGGGEGGGGGGGATVGFCGCC